MADAELSAKIVVENGVPEAMDKAQKATTSFAAQADSIGKKFSMAFKDIAFAFVAPLVILNATISAISSAIEKAKQDSKDVVDFAAKGTSVFANKGATDMAQAAARISAAEKEKGQAKIQRREAAQAYLDAKGSQYIFGDSEGNQALKQYLDEGHGVLDMARRRAKHALMFTGLLNIAEDPEMQDVLSRRAALSNARAVAFGDNPNDPAAAAAAQAAAQKASDDAAKAKGTTFKGPEGFSNVVGVGANPVMEAMMSQLEESRKQTALLEVIARPATGGGVPVDFTKSAEGRLTRSYMPE